MSKLSFNVQVVNSENNKMPKSNKGQAYFTLKLKVKDDELSLTVSCPLSISKFIQKNASMFSHYGIITKSSKFQKTKVKGITDLLKFDSLITPVDLHIHTKNDMAVFKWL